MISCKILFRYNDQSNNYFDEDDNQLIVLLNKKRNQWSIGKKSYLISKQQATKLKCYKSLKCISKEPYSTCYWYLIYMEEASGENYRSNLISKQQATKLKCYKSLKCISKVPNSTLYQCCKDITEALGKNDRFNLILQYCKICYND